MATGSRPLSPHLQVYRPQITSVLSILHRVTGVFLVVGTLLLSWWLVATAYGPDAFATIQVVLGSWIGHIVMWGFAFALFYHLCNGVRHLLWDFGWGFEIPQVKQSGMIMLGATVVLWLIALIAAYV